MTLLFNKLYTFAFSCTHALDPARLAVHTRFHPRYGQEKHHFQAPRRTVALDAKPRRSLRLSVDIRIPRNACSLGSRPRPSGHRCKGQERHPAFCRITFRQIKEARCGQRRLDEAKEEKAPPADYLDLRPSWRFAFSGKISE